MPRLCCLAEIGSDACRSPCRRSGRGVHLRRGFPRSPSATFRQASGTPPSAVAARQRARRGLADMADAERIDETLERDLAPRFDRVEQVADRDSPKPSLLLQLDFVLRAARVKMSAGSWIQPCSKNSVDLLLAQPLDVERTARDEMLQVLGLLVRAGELAGAAGDHALPTGRGGVTHHRGVERTRTMTGKLVRLRTFRPISSTTPSTCGMTSPARWIVTVSPMRTPSRSISSALCKVAFDTTTPPTDRLEMQSA